MLAAASCLVTGLQVPSMGLTPQRSLSQPQWLHRFEMATMNSAIERLREMKQRESRAVKAEVPMPAILEGWGCDAKLWSKVRSKAALIKLAEEGDEVGAKERIAMLRASPSITGETADLPTQLATWGCDAELWSKVRSKQALISLSEKGDEVAVRERLAKLRTSIAAEDARKAAPAAVATPGAKNSKLARPLSDGYSLKGALPEGFDAAAVEALLARRVEAKLIKDYASADALQKEIVDMGVYLNDRERWWQPIAAAA